jgi:hypothetical protein
MTNTNPDIKFRAGGKREKGICAYKMLLSFVRKHFF